MINRFKINCFLSLAETLSFTNTAKSLYISQQGVSKNIASLEKELGFPLFIRTSRYVSLTEEGKRCYNLFSHFIREYDNFLNEARNSYRKRIKTLRTGYQNWIDFGSEPMRARAALLKVMPEVDLIVERHSPGILAQKFIEGSLDIILIHKRFSHSLTGYKSLELNQTPMVLLAAKDNPLNHPEATYKTFSDEIFLIDAFENETLAESHLRAHQELQSYGLNPSKIVVTPNRDSAYTAAELGQGVVIANAMSEVIKRETMQAYPTETLESLMCFWHDDGTNKAAEKFAFLLQKEYRNNNPS
jgi:DNA-binding transcriptional LysR family regulator